MRSPIPDYLTEVLDRCTAGEAGALADYIPQLARVDPDSFGVAICTIDGQVYSAGDTDLEFTIQSISKPFTYALAVQELGLAAVLEKVDVEPSGEAYNEISLEQESGRPRNPMINAGAIAAYSLVPARDDAQRRAKLRDFSNRIAGRDLRLDEAVLVSEEETAFRNRAIAYLLRNAGVIDQNPDQAVNGYSEQCSRAVTVQDLAQMAATLANGGVQPSTGVRVVDADAVRQTLSVMLTCGMYDAAGDWVTTVGIPAKSGVSGGIIGVLPGQVGIAVQSPGLDAHGNSSRGVRVFERLSADMGMHIMDPPKATPSVLHGLYRTHRVGQPGREVTVYELQGDLRFAGAEHLVREWAENLPPTPEVLLDVHRTGGFDDVARRMTVEGMARLARSDDKTVYLVDPAGVLGLTEDDPEAPVLLDRAGELIPDVPADDWSSAEPE